MAKVFIGTGDGKWHQLGDILSNPDMGKRIHYNTIQNDKGHRKRINVDTGEVESLYKPDPLFSVEDTYRDRLWDAYKEWQLRQYKCSKPEGIWFIEFEKKQWWPKPIETRACCREVAQPGPKWGFSLFHHCNTNVHVANLYDIDVTHINSMHYFLVKHLGGKDEIDAILKAEEESDPIFKGVSRTPPTLKVDLFIRNAAMSAALGNHPL